MSPQAQTTFLGRSTLKRDSCAQLLLLVARTRLTLEQQATARQLATTIEDWERFASIATKKFISSLAYRHLLTTASDVIPAHALDLLRKMAYLSGIANLRVIAAQLAFHTTCIVTTGARHAYLKGFALATQSGQDATARPCRDIDVLIAASDLRPVLDAARTAGYKIYVELSLAERAKTGRDLDFLARYADVVTIFSPDGIAIEVHRRLDKQSINFDLTEALSTTETVRLSGTAIRTLAKPLHFGYLCYHHSRHFWSKLHWLADLDAIINTPDFDIEATRRIADQLGILPTIDAAIEFSALTGDPRLWDDALATDSGRSEFLAACLHNLEGDLEVEQEMRKGMPFGDFMSSWQYSEDSHGKFAAHAWLRRLRPTPRQYLRHRLPLPLHWLYVLRNATSLVVASLANLAERPANGRTRIDLGPET